MSSVPMMHSHTSIPQMQLLVIYPASIHIINNKDYLFSIFSASMTRTQREMDGWMDGSLLLLLCEKEEVHPQILFIVFCSAERGARYVSLGRSTCDQIYSGRFSVDDQEQVWVWMKGGVCNWLTGAILLGISRVHMFSILRNITWHGRYEEYGCRLRALGVNMWYV